MPFTIDRSLDRIADEVHEYLLDLGSVNQCHWEIRRDVPGVPPRRSTRDVPHVDHIRDILRVSLRLPAGTDKCTAHRVHHELRCHEQQCSASSPCQHKRLQVQRQHHRAN
jgi:hypothetical protein